MEALTAWSTLATALFTLALVVVALLALGPAKRTLEASTRASQAAEEANEQAQRDSIEQTRPYVYVELVPGLAGMQTFDIRIANSGRSAARNLTLDFDAWPVTLDDVGESLKDLFSTPRTLPPGCSIRAMWRLEGPFTDDTPEAGMEKRGGTVSVAYTSSDPSKPSYEDRFEMMIEKSGLWPVGESGPSPGNLSQEGHQFYALGQALVRRVAELGR